MPQKGYSKSGRLILAGADAVRVAAISQIAAHGKISGAKPIEAEAPDHPFGPMVGLLAGIASPKAALIK